MEPVQFLPKGFNGSMEKMQEEHQDKDPKESPHGNTHVEQGEACLVKYIHFAQLETKAARIEPQPNQRRYFLKGRPHLRREYLLHPGPGCRASVFV